MKQIQIFSFFFTLLQVLTLLYRQMFNTVPYRLVSYKRVGSQVVSHQFVNGKNDDKVPATEHDVPDIIQQNDTPLFSHPCLSPVGTYLRWEVEIAFTIGEFKSFGRTHRQSQPRLHFPFSTKCQSSLSRWVKSILLSARRMEINNGVQKHHHMSDKNPTGTLSAQKKASASTSQFSTRTPVNSTGPHTPLITLPFPLVKFFSRQSGSKIKNHC